MKKTKKIISLLLTIQMLFACTLVPSAIATDSVIESSVIGSESSEELSPMLASDCCHTYTSTSYSGGTCPKCQQSVSGTVTRCSKCGAGWVKLTCGDNFNL